MRYVRGVIALLSFLPVYTNYTLAQATESNTEVSPVGVAISVAPVVVSGQSPISSKVRMTVTNNTSRILVHTLSLTIVLNRMFKNANKESN
jgi:hypothetical protein